MKENQVSALLALAVFLIFTPVKSWADDDYLNSIKDNYELSDEQMTVLKNSGLPDPQIGMVAQLAKSSGKDLEEIIKMKTESNMGWGEIAKQLGVNPKDI